MGIARHHYSFPLASSFLKLPMVSESVLKEHYAATGTTLSLIALLIVVTFRSSFRDTAFTRKVVVVSALAAIFCWFGFIGVKTSLVYDNEEKPASEVF